MVHRIILYKFQLGSDLEETLSARCVQIRAFIAEVEPELEIRMSRPADADAERAWDLCLQLTHPKGGWRAEVAEALDRRIDQELGPSLAVRKSWSFEELPSS